MRRGTGILLVALLTLAGAFYQQGGMGASGEGPGFTLALGERGELRVLDDGHFGLDAPDALVPTSAKWTMRINGSLVFPGSEAFRTSLAAPLREWECSLRMLFYNDGVFTEMAYQAERGTAVLTFTAVNSGDRPVPVALRCALELRAPVIGLTGTGNISHEASLTAGAFSELSGLDRGIQVFSCVLPDAPELVKFSSTPDAAIGSDWQFPLDPAVNLTGATGVLFYWPQRQLGPRESYRVRLLLSAGPSEGIALSQNEHSVLQLSISPQEDFEQKPRKVVLGIGHLGPASEIEATLLFVLEDSPFTMKFLSARIGWDQTWWSDFEWTPPTPGNYTVSVLLPFFNDRNPADNFQTRSAQVWDNPFRFSIRFLNGNLTNQGRSFPGGALKTQLYIYNTGFAADSIRVSVEGLPENWTALLSGNNITLEKNRVGYFWVTVRPHHLAANGTYPFDIVGTSLSSGERQKLLMLVEIGPPPPPGNTTSPGSSQNLVPDPGDIPPPVPTRQYDTDTSGIGWFASGDQSRIVYSALAVMGIVAAIAFLMVAFYQAANLRTISAMRRIIKRALYGLATGDEYRKTIYEAYKRMCAHLEKYGYTREDHVTPREFVKALKLALPLDTRSIRILTGLFEEARYSDHDIGEGDRRAAIESLKYIEAELDKLTVFKEQRSPWERIRRRMGLGEA